MKPFSCLLTAFSLIFLFGACDNLFSFDVNGTIDEQEVKGSVAGIPNDVLPLGSEIQIDLEAETGARDTGPASAVYLRSLEFKITDTGKDSLSDEDTFDFVSRADLYIESKNPSSTLPRIKIAEAVSPTGETMVFEPIANQNIIAYVREGATIASEASGQAPPDGITYDGKYTLTVEVL